MNIKDWGEEAFIDYLKAQFFKMSSQSNSIVGIGDDCAVMPGHEGRSLLITTDALVEGIHFIKKQISPEDLGYKSIAVNVSDIAAMGGQPEHAFLSLALPKQTDRDWITNFLQGIKKACSQWDVSLLGGDTVGSKRDIFLSITLTGSASPNCIKYRHQAQKGDIICVTDYLGDSGAGLKALQEGIEKSTSVQYLIQRHFYPRPSPEEGMWLASQEGVHAMMDLSDGLYCDLQRLTTSSQCGALIEMTRLPLSQELALTASSYHWDAFRLALEGGEDYCLLVTISPHVYKSIQQKFLEKFNHPIYPIGEILPFSSSIIYHQQGKKVDISLEVFNHFQ